LAVRNTSNSEFIAQGIERIHAAGWSVGVAAFAPPDGSPRACQVDGRNGENVAGPGAEPRARRGRGRSNGHGDSACSVGTGDRTGRVEAA
jgi:hypothetical protein